jgi:DNA-binding transcriptional LysR family regulator
MEMRHLRYFIAVAEQLNFSRAAEQLQTAQPSLSQQIRQLEDEVGVEFFDRSKRQIALTPAGEEFLIAARALVAQLELAIANVRELGRGVRGELRVGYTMSAMISALPEAIRAYRAGHDQVRLTLRAMAPLEIFDAVLRREVDVGVILTNPTTAVSPEIDVRQIDTMRVSAVVPIDHPLARKRSIAVEEIGSETLILYDRVLAGLYDFAMQICRERGFVPARIVEADRVETILGLVAAGEGVSLVPRAYESLGFRGVAYLALRPNPDPFAVVVVRNKKTQSKLATEFAATCARIARGGDR